MKCTCARLLTAAVVGLASVLPFVAAGRYGLINLDDYVYVLSYPEVTGGLSLAGVRWAFTWIGDSMWAPLTWLSYMADYSVGWGVTGMHWLSLVLHGVNAAILFCLLASLSGADRRSALVAAVAALTWSIHPLRVESVVWIAGRKDVLSAFFFLSALLCWSRGSRASLVASILLLAVGGLAKSSVMVFPAFAIGLDVFQARRRPWWAYVAVVVLSLAFAAESGWAQKTGGAMEPTGIPWSYMLVNSLAALTVYVGNALWPNGLALQCLLRYPDFPRWSPLGLLALLAFAWWGYGLARRAFRSRGIAGIRDEAMCFGGVLLCLVGLAPFVGLLPFGAHAFADRFTLLPSLGLSFGLVALWRWSESLASCRMAQTVGRVAAFFAVAACGLLTVRQTGFWKDDVTLFSHTLRVDGFGNLAAHHMIGLYYWEYKHDMEKVCQHMSHHLTALPWYAERYGHYAPFLIEAAYATGRRDLAEDACAWLGKWDWRQVRRARREGDFVLKTTISEIYGETIRLLNTDGQLENAKKEFAKAFARAPRHFLTREIAWQIAMKEGNADAIAKALDDCTHSTGDSYFRNRWAKNHILPRTQ